jgi:hypothetical protein
LKPFQKPRKKYKPSSELTFLIVRNVTASYIILCGESTSSSFGQAILSVVTCLPLESIYSGIYIVPGVGKKYVREHLGETLTGWAKKSSC